VAVVFLEDLPAVDNDDDGRFAMYHVPKLTAWTRVRSERAVGKLAFEDRLYITVVGIENTDRPETGDHEKPAVRARLTVVFVAMIVRVTMLVVMVVVMIMSARSGGAGAEHGQCRYHCEKSKQLPKLSHEILLPVPL
jgi:hypothetical protein